MEVFKFKDDDVKHLITRELKLDSRMSKSFDYIYDKLKGLKHHMVAGDVLSIPNDEEYIKSGLFMEGKNYHWSSIDANDIQLLIRKYGEHLTIYTRFEKRTKVDKKFKKIYPSGYRSKITYGAFELYTDTSVEYYKNKRKEETDIKNYDEYGEDFFYCNPFYDFNLLINDIIKLIRDNNFWLLWNESALPRPDRVKLKGYFNGETIYSMDKMVYCAEELSNIHVVLFSENEMVEKIKTFKVGDMLSAYKITKVNTKVENDYYHNAGLELQNTNFSDSKPSWCDVYSLTQYYFEYVFPKEESDELSANEVEVLEKHYRKIATKMLDETTNKKNLTHIKEAMRNMPHGFGKVSLFSFLNEEENS